MIQAASNKINMNSELYSDSTLMKTVALRRSLCTRFLQFKKPQSSFLGVLLLIHYSSSFRILNLTLYTGTCDVLGKLLNHFRGF